MSQNNEPCQNCGIVHNAEDVMRNLPNIISLAMNNSVPEQYKGSRPANDDFWTKLKQGPDKEIFKDLLIDGDIDDLITTFAKEWMNSIQSIINMAAIMEKIVVKYDIKENTSPSTIPWGVKQIYNNAASLLEAQKALISRKDVMMALATCRKDWGSLTAYVNAPQNERQLWLDCMTVRAALSTIH